MNPVPERYSDLLGERNDPSLLACVEDLDATCDVFTLPPERDHALARALMARAAHPNRRGLRTFLHRLPLPVRPMRRRLAPALMATLLVGSGAAVYLHGSGPTPVDAQTVLHRAAAASPGANEATHATYRVSSSDGHTGTADVWIGYDGSGAASQLALKLTMSGDGQSGAGLNANVAAAGPNLLHVYDDGEGATVRQQPVTSGQPGAPTVIAPAAVGPSQALKGIVVGTLLAQKLSKQPDAYKLQQETLDGVSVYALQPSETGGASGGITFYFNAQTYVLEGADWTQGSVNWKARLDPTSYRVVPLSSVPAGTFGAIKVGPGTGSAGTQVGIGGGKNPAPGMPGTSGGLVIAGGTPDGVRIDISADGSSDSASHVTVSASIPGQGGSGVDLTPALTAACKTTSGAFAAAMRPGPNSLLAICQKTNPGITADQLVAALLVPAQSALDGLVHSGTITASQESSDLTSLRTGLTHLVTTDKAGIPAPGSGVAQQQP